jgi:hypothetical protein
MQRCAIGKPASPVVLGFLGSRWDAGLRKKFHPFSSPPKNRGEDLGRTFNR